MSLYFINGIRPWSVYCVTLRHHVFILPKNPFRGKFLRINPNNFSERSWSISQLEEDGPNHWLTRRRTKLMSFCYSPFSKQNDKLFLELTLNLVRNCIPFYSNKSELDHHSLLDECFEGWVENLLRLFVEDATQ